METTNNCEVDAQAALGDNVFRLLQAKLHAFQQETGVNSEDQLLSRISLWQRIKDIVCRMAGGIKKEGR